MMSLKVSVILCGYNQETLVRQAVESVLNQTYKNLELIAIDNGSTDGSAGILKGFAADPRVRLVLYPENSFVTRRLNEAVAQASGEFISVIYADDYYLPEKLERQMACFKWLPSSFGVVYGPGRRTNIITGEKWIPPSPTCCGHVLKKLLEDPLGLVQMNPISPLIRRECLLQTPFSEKVFIEGEFFFLRLALKTRFQFLSKPTVVMQDHLTNFAKAIKAHRDYFIQSVKTLAHDPGFPPQHLPLLMKQKARTLMNFGWQGIRVAEDPTWARECYQLAIQTKPLLRLHPRTLAGIVLSHLPINLLHLLNLLANKVTGKKGNLSFVESPGGCSDQGFPSP